MNMDKIIFSFLAVLSFCAACGAQETAQQQSMQKIKMTFNNNTVIIAMQNNNAAKRVMELLPAEFSFRDFAGEEKITNFAKPLDFKGAPRGMTATAGKMFIYAPWGNMGIFYKNHGTSPDSNLIELGTVETGLETLAAQTAPFTAKLEIIK